MTKKPRPNERLLSLYSVKIITHAFDIVDRAVAMPAEQPLLSRVRQAFDPANGEDETTLQAAVSAALIVTAKNRASKCETLAAFNRAEPFLQSLVTTAIDFSPVSHTMDESTLWSAVLSARPKAYHSDVKEQRKAKRASPGPR